MYLDIDEANLQTEMPIIRRANSMSKHKAIPKKTRIMLYDRYNHKCAYCGCDMEYKDMQVDHIKSVYANADIK